LAPDSGGTVTVFWLQHGGEPAGLGAGSMRGRWMPRPRVCFLRGALGAAGLGGTHHAAVAFGVRALFGHGSAAVADAGVMA
jgi:hypothetical protein